MTYEYYGYPPDWLDKYQAEIKKVTAADVNRVAAKYLHKDQLAVLVVGNAKEFDKPLSSLGAVKKIDITIPPPPGAADGARTTPSPPHPIPKAKRSPRKSPLPWEACPNSSRSRPCT